VWVVRKTVAAVFVVGVALVSWVPPVGATGPLTVAPPPTISANCARDVSTAMQSWLNGLPAGTTVAAPAGSCYLVNEGLILTGAHGLTISGGTWRNGSTPVPGASPKSMNPVFWLVGGSTLALQGLTISGGNAGGYSPAGAFAAGIRSDGVIGLSVSDVTINGVYGDGIELTALRAAGDIASTILRPTENASVTNVTIAGAGRQGMTLADVSGATLSAITLGHIGINAIDVEADQWNEGAVNVTVNGCKVGSPIGGLFFANGGSGAGSLTGDITVEDCTMTSPAAGDAVLVQDPSPAQDSPRGPFTFVNDVLECGSSVYVACVQDTRGRIAIDTSTLQMPPGTIHERVYDAAVGSTVTFTSDNVAGYGSLGEADGTSSVSIAGGSWMPYGGRSGPAPVGGSTTTTSSTTTTTSSTVPRPSGSPTGGGTHGSSGMASSSATTAGQNPAHARLAALEDPAHPAAGTSTAAPYTDVAVTIPWPQRILWVELFAAVAAYVTLLLARKRREHRQPATVTTTLGLLHEPDGARSGTS